MSCDSVSRLLQQIVSQHEIYKKSTDVYLFTAVRKFVSVIQVYSKPYLTYFSEHK